MYDHLDFPLNVKSVDDGTGRFTGFASTYGNEDLTGDVVQRGAFTNTLAKHGASFVLLWQHRPEVPIGTVKATDTEQGLLVEGQLVMEVAAAREALALMKARAVKAMSIGYETIKQSFDGGRRLLKDLELWEVSLVTFPANPQAVVTGVKATDVQALANYYGGLLATQNADLRAGLAHLKGLR